VESEKLFSIVDICAIKEGSLTLCSCSNFNMNEVCLTGRSHREENEEKDDKLGFLQRLPPLDKYDRRDRASMF
jgi:hypothetical protein